MPLLWTEETQTAALPPRKPWPDAVAFREAVQNPALLARLGFDNDTKLCLNRQGLPLTYTGRFAVVFRVRDANGTDWAVRCFTSENGEPARAQARYESLAHHLEMASSEARVAFVPFRFVAHGVDVGGETYPALVMRWANGTPLGRWVDTHQNDSAALLRACAALGSLLETLEAAHIAHGDWQHDNLLVSDDGQHITLVDYDGVWVPGLGLAPVERGHPNYQQPARTASDWGPGLDRFPCLLIQTALYSVAHEPALWKASDGESCLFTRPDLAAPQDSPVFATVRRVAENHSSLAEALNALQTACAFDTANVEIAPIQNLAHAAQRQGELGQVSQKQIGEVRNRRHRSRKPSLGSEAKKSHKGSAKGVNADFFYRLPIYILFGSFALRLLYLGSTPFLIIAMGFCAALILPFAYFLWPRNLRYNKMLRTQSKTDWLLKLAVTDLKTANARLQSINQDPANSSLVTFVDAALREAKISVAAPHLWEDSTYHNMLHARGIHSLYDLHPVGSVLEQLNPMGGEPDGVWERIRTELLELRLFCVEQARVDWDVLADDRRRLPAELARLSTERAGLIQQHEEHRRKIRQVGDVSFSRFLAYLIGL